MGEGTNGVKNSGYFPASNAVVMSKIEVRPGWTKTKSCSSARETNNKKVTSKLEQGLNFTVNTDFWFCNDDFCKKPEGKKKRCFFFLWRQKRSFCSCPSSKGNILQKTLTFFRLLDISTWRTVYLMLTTDSLGNVRVIEKVAMF